MRPEEALHRLTQRLDLSRPEMEALFGALMDGQVSDPMKAALLVALRMKGEAPAEIAGAAAAMRSRVVPVPHSRADVVDTCGTGGDGRGTFNISTAAALVAAAGGVPVAKHGNRSISSRSGSADVLAALGVDVNVPPAVSARALDEIGIAFLFAPLFHPAMKEVMGVRRELALRTVFNVLGPLTNPAGARRQVMGVYDVALVEVIARVLAELGSEHALVVHGADGLDEITTTGATTVGEVRAGEVAVYEVEPEALGVARATLADLAGGEPAHNAELMRGVLAGEPGPLSDVTAVNAGAALYVGGVAADLPAGVARAREILPERRGARQASGAGGLLGGCRGVRGRGEGGRRVTTAPAPHTGNVPDVLLRITARRRERLGSADPRMAAGPARAEPLGRSENAFLAALTARPARSDGADSGSGAGGSVVGAGSRTGGMAGTAASADHASAAGAQWPLATVTAPAVIAEVKMGSPRLGSLAGRVDPEAQARAYAAAGAAALSVVVEPDFFGGSYELLAACRAASGLPTIAKDFVVHPRQLADARAAGADAILLIAALYDRDELLAWARLARGLGLAPLIETHDPADLDLLAGEPWELVGVNNRDLRTFEVDFEHSLALAPRLPPGALKVAESGIATAAEVARLAAAGFNALLIGESLLTAPDPGAKLRELLGGSIAQGGEATPRRSAAATEVGR